jgi:polar amino acid transport system permease protein
VKRPVPLRCFGPVRLFGEQPGGIAPRPGHRKHLGRGTSIVSDNMTAVPPPPTASVPDGAIRPRRLTRRQRLAAIRSLQYGLLVAAGIALLFAVDWATLRRTFFDPIFVFGGTKTTAQGKVVTYRNLFPEILTTALFNTVKYAMCSFVFGLALGTVIALMKLSAVRAYRWLANIYIEFFRGLPALLVFIVVGYGLPLAFPGFRFAKIIRIPFTNIAPSETLAKVTVALGMVSAAYLAETVRAGLQAVPRGQTEAARSLGMSQGRALKTIVIPQAFRIVLPPLTNEFILINKDAALVSILGLAAGEFELLKFGRDTMNTVANATPIVAAGFCYLLITLPLTFLVKWLESNQKKAR